MAKPNTEYPPIDAGSRWFNDEDGTFLTVIYDGGDFLSVFFGSEQDGWTDVLSRASLLAGFRQEKDDAKTKPQTKKLLE